MSDNWNQLAVQYFHLISPTGELSEAEVHIRNMAVRDLIGRAAASLPKDNPIALSWFIDALQRDPDRLFVAQVMSVANPVPRCLLDPLLIAALLEPNPSASRAFVAPCVRSFGGPEVVTRIAALAGHPGVAEHGGVNKAMYWVP
ncbi:hypothetical protein [Jeongeupia naejangsanensis]|uniref:HEAT repeat domain-containing protein n=1 Tax=Jeongeupia naejangsanensis TaxID=613195 RepID=A0ABS2BKF5_9NEIS|nr:hypothetical protein [Jeongeupia naejangsanensis]MBM3116081.1 hypothetical protein [Jeongeupia naejangsanensis]